MRDSPAARGGPAVAGGSSRHVTLHLWRVPPSALPAVLWRMARDRSRLRTLAGVRFAKLLGTGRGSAFGPAQTDPTRWAALIGWDGPVAARGFDRSPAAKAWQALALTSCRLDLQPLTSRGSWAGQQPFAPAPAPAPARPAGAPDGPVLALTRARLRPHRAAVFWRAVPPVAEALAGRPGLLTAFGIGEAPIGWQGTVSVWRSHADLTEFAYRHPRHRQAIERTSIERWYAEELFARFAVLDVAGDRGVIDWRG